jgi:hypothetical protein
LAQKSFWQVSQNQRKRPELPLQDLHLSELLQDQPQL